MFIKLNFAVGYKRKLKYSKNNNIFNKIQYNQNKLKITYIRNVNKFVFYFSNKYTVNFNARACGLLIYCVHVHKLQKNM